MTGKIDETLGINWVQLVEQTDPPAELPDADNHMLYNEEGAWYGINDAGAVDFIDSAYGGELEPTGTRFENSDSVASGTGYVKITFGAGWYDTDAFVDDALDRVVIPIGLSGLYLLDMHVNFDYAGTGNRGFYIFLNGTTRLLGESSIGSPNGQTELVGAALWNFADSDYIEFYVHQNSGSVLGFEWVFSMQRLCDAPE